MTDTRIDFEFFHNGTLAITMWYNQFTIEKIFKHKVKLPYHEVTHYSCPPEMYSAHLYNSIFREK
ncbi:hypothetical protein Fmac_026889 [Flemingia macrophylla]|uniref:Uncharacterized protein n=1 Tax=Flemingia macrophylla TaxID=520843 RepID=A0ABD1LG48_9FABA